nr:MAG TPA: hypothetical protein [Caudoviricetes sp.]
MRSRAASLAIITSSYGLLTIVWITSQSMPRVDKNKSMAVPVG